MSLECSECERDARGGHDESCSRYQPPCGDRFLLHGFGTIACELPPGHRGSHETDDGYWWPRADEVASW